MKSVVVAASYLTVSVLLAPALAAQESESQPPPARVDVAVKRSPEPARVPGANRSPDAARVRDANRAPETERAPDRAVERPVREVRTETPPPARDVVSSDNGAPPALNASSDSGADDQGQRRGAVRRPPVNVDHAVPRSAVPPRGTYPTVYRPYPYRAYPYRGYPYYYYPSYRRYYDPWGYGSFGLGYFYYSPWAWSASFGYGYGGPGYYPYYPYSYYPGAWGYDIGSVKIKVEPRDAEVWVDGYYAGSVDDFDGTFQALKLDSGPYRIEIRKPGYETLSFDVRVQPDRTITFRGELRATP